MKDDSTILKKISNLIEGKDPLKDSDLETIMQGINSIVDRADGDEAKDLLKGFIIKETLEEFIVPCREFIKKSLEHDK